MHTLSRCLLSVLLAGAGVAPGLVRGADSEEKLSSTIIVKLKAPLADQLDAWLQIPDAPAAPEVLDFSAKHPFQSMKPLYPALSLAKRTARQSGLELAQSIREKFPQRSARLRDDFNPPDVSHTFVMAVSSTPDLAAYYAALRADSRVEYAEAEHQFVPASLTDDPYLRSSGSWQQPYEDLWGLHRIHAPEAWDRTAGEGVLVAVVDTGIDRTHADIASNVWKNAKEIPNNGIDDDGNGYIDDVYGWNFNQSSADVRDVIGHGTHVAGTIAAAGNNGLGVVGVAWKAKVMALSVYSAPGFSTEEEFAPAILYAVHNGADVLTLAVHSYGKTQSVQEAIDYARALGVVVVAAGELRLNSVTVLDALAQRNAIIAAAEAPDGGLSGSSVLSNRTDIIAPGEDILSLRAAGTNAGTAVGTGYTRMSGTSMAAAHVAGMSALVLAAHPEYSNDDVRQVIRAYGSGRNDPGTEFPGGVGAADADAAIQGTDLLEARITAPSTGSEVGGVLTITGVARGSGFARYVLEYGHGASPQKWNLIASRQQQVSGKLGELNLDALDAAQYVVRLSVYHRSGRVFTDRIDISNTSVTITDPERPASPALVKSMRPGVRLKISGRMNVGDYQRYRVEWAKGLNASTGWSTEGITLPNGGVAMIRPGVMAEWDTSAINEADTYTIRVVAEGDGTQSVATTLVYLEPALLSNGWPVLLNLLPAASAGVAPLTTADGKTLLMSAGVDPKMQMVLDQVSPDGTVQERMPPFFGVPSMPVVGDLDGDGKPEVVVQSLDTTAWFKETGDARIFTAPPANTIQFVGQPVIADLDGDGRAEILRAAWEVQSHRAWLYAWTSAGRMLNGNFPISLSYTPGSGQPPDGRFFVVADLKGTGRPWIIVPTMVGAERTQLVAFDQTGARQPSWVVDEMAGSPLSIVASDLDHRGQIDLVLAVGSSQDGVVLHVIGPDGKERTGWPSFLHAVTSEVQLATADLERTGRESIVVSCATGLYVIQNDGSLHSGQWPLLGWGQFGPAVIGDVDGDGYPEIVASRRVTLPARDPEDPEATFTTKMLTAYLPDGTVSRSWRMTRNVGAGDNARELVPLLGDFDHDGKTDIAVWSPFYQNDQTIQQTLAILTTGTPYRAVSQDWPSIYGDAQNRAVRERPAAGWDPGPNPNCSYSLNSSGIYMSGTGATGSFQVNTQPNCSWSVINSSSWIRVVDTQGVGPGTVRYQISANRGTFRNGVLAISGRSYRVGQANLGSDGLPLLSVAPHVIANREWSTKVTLVNPNNEAAEVLLTPVDDGGTPVVVAMSSTQAGWSGTRTARIIAESLPAHGTLRITLQSSDFIGALRLQSTLPVRGQVLLRNVASGGTVTVPFDSARSAVSRFVFDQTGGAVNGVALANPGTSPVQVEVIARDSSGAVMGSRTVELASGSRQSFALSDGLVATAGAQGTVEFRSADGPFAVMMLRLRGSLMSLLPSFTPDGAGGGLVVEYRVQASMEGKAPWVTVVPLLNQSDAEASVDLTLKPGAAGAAAPVLSIDGVEIPSWTTNAKIAPHGVVWLQILPAPGDGHTGTLLLQTAAQVSGYALVRSEESEEYVVPVAPAGSIRTLAPIDVDEGLGRSVSIRTAGTGPEWVTLTTWSDSGERVDSWSQPIQPGTTWLAGYSDLNGSLRGTVEVTSKSGAPVYVYRIGDPGLRGFQYVPLMAVE